MSTIFMFSGQGSQYYQMGKSLYDQDHLFRKNFSLIDEMIYDNLKLSIIKEIYAIENKISIPFDHTKMSNLSLYAIELAMMNTLNDNGIEAEIFLGYSLGTIIASVASKCVSLETGIDLLSKQSELFDESIHQGVMLAVLTTPKLYYDSALLRDNSDLAGINFDSNFIISLPKINYQKVTTYLNELSVSYQSMPISKPYHSRWMEPAKYQFMDLYNPIKYGNPTIPIYCCSGDKRLPTMEAATLWNAVREPIYFQNIINILEKTGPHYYIDVGPSGILATLLKYTLPKDSKSKTASLMSPFQRSGIISYNDLKHF